MREGPRYKAVRPDGTDFYTGTVDYLSGGIIVAPTTSQSVAAVGDATCYLSMSTSPTDCAGMRWPCRLLVVEPLYEWTPDANLLPNKRACRSLRVVDERPAHEALGPQGEKVAALIERARSLSGDKVRQLDAAWDAARGAVRGEAWDAAWDAARGEALGAALDAALGTALDAALALVVADLITDAQFRALAGPWIDVIGDPR